MDLVDEETGQEGDQLVRDEESVDSKEMQFQMSALRLSIMSLKAVNNNFDKDSYEQYNGDVNVLWKTVQIVMNKAFGNSDTNDAIHLMGKLLYFESELLEYELFQFQSDSIKGSRSILEACGLITIVEIKNQNGISDKMIKLRKPSTSILEEVIREENKSNEEAYLMECSYIVDRYRIRYVPLVKTHNKYYLGLWTNMLNHDNLVKELIGKYYSVIRYFETELGKQISNFQMITIRTLERLEQIFGELNEWTFKIHLCKVRLVLRSDKWLNGFKLNHWRELSDLFQRFDVATERWLVKDHNLAAELKDIGESMQEIALQDLSLQSEFLEGSLRAFKMSWKFLKQKKSNKDLSQEMTCRIWLSMFKCLRVLKKHDEAVELLTEIQRIFLDETKKVPNLLNNLLSNYYLELGEIFKELALFGDTTNSKGYRSCDPEFPVIVEFRNLVKFMFEYVACRVKENQHTSVDIVFPVSYAYLMCLNMLSDFDKLLPIICEVDEILKKVFIEIKWNSNLRLTNEVNNYFELHKLLFKIVRENGVGVIQDRDAVLMESAEFSKTILNQTFQSAGVGNINLTPYDYQTGGPSHIISCYMHLGRMDDLIQYSSEYRQLILGKFGHNYYDFANEWIWFLETMSERVDTAPNHADVHKLIESTKSLVTKTSQEITKRGGNNSMKFILKEKTDKLILFCEKSLCIKEDC